MRLGIYGGTFDPVHYGHLLLAEQCREQCRLDEVWFVPANVAPHKTGAGTTSGKARAEMLEFAVAGCPRLRVSRMELERPGPSYTVDTLQTLHDDDPRRELFFLIGADSLTDLPTWREPQRIARLAIIVAVNRGDRPLPDMASLEARLGQEAMARVRFVQMPGVDLSATDIRRRVREGRGIRYMVPRAVEVYIQEHRLYQ